MAVTGTPRTLLRLEGAAVFAAALVTYHALGALWSLFAILFLAPDLAFLGYLRGPRPGAVAYNATHTYLGPAVLAALMLTGTLSQSWHLVLIWVGHVGFDRALGFGLKYPTAFADTHLSPPARPVAPA